MSDDLISRKALLKELREIMDEPHNTMFLMGVGAAVSIVEHRETAFDKEKVIEELRQEAMYELGIPEKKFNSDEGEYSSYCSISFSQAKRIVKKGGIE